jgi:hypothetical protein
VDKHGCEKLIVPAMEHEIVVLTVLKHDAVVCAQPVSASDRSVNVDGDVYGDQNVRGLILYAIHAVKPV